MWIKISSSRSVQGFWTITGCLQILHLLRGHWISLLKSIQTIRQWHTWMVVAATTIKMYAIFFAWIFNKPNYNKFWWLKILMWNKKNTNSPSDYKRNWFSERKSSYYTHISRMSDAANFTFAVWGLLGCARASGFSLISERWDDLGVAEHFLLLVGIAVVPLHQLGLVPLEVVEQNTHRRRGKLEWQGHLSCKKTVRHFLEIFFLLLKTFPWENSSFYAFSGCTSVQ